MNCTKCRRNCFKDQLGCIYEECPVDKKYTDFLEKKLKEMLEIQFQDITLAQFKKWLRSISG